MITKHTPASITSVKGSHHGTVETCCEWQAETQGSFASVSIDESDTDTDVDGIQFDAENMTRTVADVIAALAREMAR